MLPLLREFRLQSLHQKKNGAFYTARWRASLVLNAAKLMNGLTERRIPTDDTEFHRYTLHRMKNVQREGDREICNGHCSSASAEGLGQCASLWPCEVNEWGRMSGLGGWVGGWCWSSSHWCWIKRGTAFPNRGTSRGRRPQVDLVAVHCNCNCNCTNENNTSHS